MALWRVYFPLKAPRSSSSEWKNSASRRASSEACASSCPCEAWAPLSPAQSDPYWGAGEGPCGSSLSWIQRLASSQCYRTGCGRRKLQRLTIIFLPDYAHLATAADANSGRTDDHLSGTEQDTVGKQKLTCGAGQCSPRAGHVADVTDVPPEAVARRGPLKLR